MDASKPTNIRPVSLPSHKARATSHSLAPLPHSIDLDVTRLDLTAQRSWRSSTTFIGLAIHFVSCCSMSVFQYWITRRPISALLVVALASSRRRRICDVTFEPS
ncbi:hypothetical protein BU24DRAFT_425621 [Aaosphaeria arxii CBS 175.79]|uniref:Uncharacterized protein n=1 Tax=Aaosphaeria arxii CBS 175.79 TaxID=1450172 RepID=A0A6A5XJK2_9PLEO|nr:uncharacterized protein BU24DRAFT_425621 [Aaosphaeria arxii CBS 175.79]KAF2013059.1 hypothetical protein BU24DRAFT_425621 [Aaosphaeria arxii CBS 175.79]